VETLFRHLADSRTCVVGIGMPTYSSELSGKTNRHPPFRRDYLIEILGHLGANMLKRRPASVYARRPSLSQLGPCGRDAPAPSIFLRLGPQTMVGGHFRRLTDIAMEPTTRRGLKPPQPKKGEIDVGLTTQPKTQIVVAVVRIVVVANCRARVVLIVVPGAAAPHPSARSQGTPLVKPAIEVCSK